MTRRGMAGDADEAPASAPPRAVHNEYHLEDIDFALIEGRTIQLDNICFRNSDFVGSMQLRWITTGGPPQQQNHGVSADGEDPIMAACPYGYGVCLLYLPPRTAREQERWRCPSVTAGEQTLLQLSRDILGSMETSFNCFQWLLSPPVESYEIPGLIHFVAVDRRTNSGIVASFHRMMHQKPRHVQEAVASLKRLVALNISRAHTLLHAGYSEGLWGHFGMQFFYCVCAVDETAALTSPPPPSTAPASHEPPRRSFFSFGGEGLLSPPSSAPSKAAAAADAATAAAAASSSQPAEESSTSTVDTADSLFGSLDARLKLPSATLPHLVLRPMLLPDFTCNEPEGHRVVEVYAVFVGTMSPAEVCKGVEKLLRSRVLPPRGGTY
ncbi:hypothetical protein DQ04_04971000 [Trypanosoma grayi]|uniref:hypothetical protein n=1 Tax=Trypanosoma grayi TaxID=71804 RepID=UPI0004F4B6EF|nr:hypothetical protein DQ04_04971000 [Trypanosoma grayi]KEG09592.1 hypothetical protein DQ04_04971000 [Trypanosoma grayi]